MYSSVPINQQIPVYFRKFARINIRESAWKFVLFAGIIAVIIGAIGAVMDSLRIDASARIMVMRRRSGNSVLNMSYIMELQSLP